MNQPQALSAEDIARVRASFDLLWPVSSGMSTMFYQHLFEIAPEVQALFRFPMDEQRRKFIATLAVIVSNVDTASGLAAATVLARQHVTYGVRPDHYPMVGQALLWSLEKALGERWTAEDASSWSKAYAIVSDHMVRTTAG
jgi:hemoglobin-like flavoprotein